MSIKNNLEILSGLLQHQRDEITLKLHLAGMEIKDEWEKLDAPWAQFRRKMNEIEDETKQTTENIMNDTKIIGDELKNAYQRILSRIDE